MISLKQIKVLFFLQFLCTSQRDAHVRYRENHRIQQQNCYVFSDWQIIIMRTEICKGFISRQSPSQETLLQNTDGDATGAEFKRISSWSSSMSSWNSNTSTGLENQFLILSLY